MTAAPLRLTVMALAAMPVAVTAQVAAGAPPAPVEHRLTPDEIAAAQADGAERNRAADLLAMTRGDPSLALPLERKRPLHGAFEVGIGSNGAREVAGEVSTSLGDSATATVGGSYTQFGRQRYRPF
jgi:hypothetical protein